MSIEAELTGPREPDWKEFVRPEVRDLSHALHETDCPNCGRHVGALIVDGPDPVFADVECPQCHFPWTERVA